MRRAARKSDEQDDDEDEPADRARGRDAGLPLDPLLQRKEVDEEHDADPDQDEIEREEDVDEGLGRLPPAGVADRDVAARGDGDDGDRREHAERRQHGPERPGPGVTLHAR